MSTDLTGRVALVTGAGRGIGEAIARALHRNGAKVALLARTRSTLDGLARELGGRAFPVAGDVRDAASLDAAIRAAEEHLGPVDIAVNNAGGPASGGFLPFEAVPDGDWLGTFESNVLSAVRVCRVLVPKMATRGWGRVVNISSESGTQPDPIGIDYAAAKGALNVLTKGLSKAYGQRGVTVNAVSPAFIDTSTLRALLAGQPGAEGVPEGRLAQTFLSAFRPDIVVGRPGRPEDVGEAVAFLASDAASFITGIDLRVDGGSVAAL